ncbi:hypothetical protein [Erythrobacter sp. WG]|uniref:hypothetical protein n=1 Tax=Erythrobacter sp. WG TaxID=2985510 RepID=UPI002271CB89|nr:hypothetical protein [Erythrobacter sp. WG]MCX9147473.1 hypothetical protein [Erythrobacter sp. WG]
MASPPQTHLNEHSGETRDVVEFRFEAGGPISLHDLAKSFAAIDTIYMRLSGGEERLSVTELRSGSIIAVLAPFVPLMNQVVPYVAAATTLSDFTRKMKKAIDGFMETERPVAPPTDTPPIASELAEVMKPLAGRKGAEFGFAHVRYRSKDGKRVVEVEARYEGAQIDRAVINAERFAEGSVHVITNEPPITQERNFLSGVQMILHQANRGPAKAKGATGDKGVVEAVSDKALPVYFAEGVNRLKDRMIRSAKNPLKYVYQVDVWVHREGGAAKAYTVTEVQQAAPLVDGAPMVPNKKKPRSRRGAGG